MIKEEDEKKRAAEYMRHGSRSRDYLVQERRPTGRRQSRWAGGPGAG